jgi:hypothetical protein
MASSPVVAPLLQADRRDSQASWPFYCHYPCHRCCNTRTEDRMHHSVFSKAKSDPWHS